MSTGNVSFLIALEANLKKAQVKEIAREHGPLSSFESVVRRRLGVNLALRFGAVIHTAMISAKTINIIITFT